MNKARREVYGRGIGCDKMLLLCCDYDYSDCVGDRLDGCGIHAYANAELEGAVCTARD